MYKDYYEAIIKVGNGLWIGRKNLRYDFGYKDDIIESECINFSYISGKIICLKKGKKIIVYSTFITNNYGVYTAEKLLEFSAFSKVAYGKIICERNTYLIDGNCQIKYSERTHIN